MNLRALNTYSNRGLQRFPAYRQQPRGPEDHFIRCTVTLSPVAASRSAWLRYACAAVQRFKLIERDISFAGAPICGYTTGDLAPSTLIAVPLM